MRKLKYLKDHFTIEAETDIKQIIAAKNQIIFETRLSEPLNLSLDFLRENEKAFETIKKIAKNHKNRKQDKPILADRISDEYLESNIESEVMINLEEIRNKFVATSDNLFNFILNYDFHKEVDFDERVTVFCQIISQYEQELVVEDDFQKTNNIEFAIVYSR